MLEIQFAASFLSLSVSEMHQSSFSRARFWCSLNSLSSQENKGKIYDNVMALTRVSISDTYKRTEKC